MKTIEEMYKEITGSEELIKEYNTLALEDKEAVAEFLKAHDCEATVDEFNEYVKSQYEGEVSDDASENVAGGRRRK